MKNIILKVGAFFCCFVLFYYCLSYILAKPIDQWWEASGLKYVYKNPKCYDVIFCGTSMTVVNVNIQELYENYGISGVTLGAPEQAVFLSYYTLEEALKYQDPKVVFFDAKAMFYSEEKIAADFEREEHYYLHYSLDNMKNNYTKYLAVKQAQKLKPTINTINYFIDLYYNHSNWENIGKTNFLRTSGSHVMNGNLILLNVVEGFEDVRNTDISSIPNNGDKEAIPTINMSYFQKMYDLCQAKDIELVLLWGAPVEHWNWGYYNAISSIAEEYNLSFFDINLCENEIGFDWKYDMHDSISHTNVSGTKKWTDYIGEYLCNNYIEFESRDPKYYEKLFSPNSEKYNHIVHAMNDKISLLNATKLNDYLDALARLEDDENIIFISSADEIFSNLSNTSIKKMNELGLLANVSEQSGLNYVASIYKSDIREVALDTDIVESNTINNQIDYKLENGNISIGKNASVMINGNEAAQGGSGLNIVVYNVACGETLSSVYFDVSKNENPFTTRKVNVQYLQNQYEAEPNKWIKF